MKIIKWLFALVLAVGLFGVVGIYSQLDYLEGITPFYSKLLLQTNWLFPFFQIILLLLAVLLFVLIVMTLAKHVSKKQTTIQRKTGQLTFPLHTLESIAATAAQTYAEADDIHTQVTLDKQDRAVVAVTLDGDQRTQFITKSREIQAAVTQAMKNMAGIETNRVDVKVKNTKKDMGLLPFSKKQSRVE